MVSLTALPVDYRRLNQVTQPQVYTLPRISDLLDSVGNKRIFSTFDMEAGFWQIPVHPADIEKTAFVTFLGLFEFVRMPFGLMSAPQTFQDCVDGLCLQQFLSGSVWLYLDDAVLGAMTPEEHLRDISQFLRVLRANGLKLKMAKCHFARSNTLVSSSRLVTSR
ncbi:hypothetical protein L596_006386 [Steinernema carpocapsae]|uniref:Reverse transcriptase domain-containing protein n=1 Tax=Steinernema carpocapsae TaxID=34508 RepID=A0A4U8V439_STECR|nr:hypothetical protein L596_006386 [Steinernema carpocapsae]